MTTWGQLLSEASAVLPPHEAERIVERASGYDRAQLVLARAERVPDRVFAFYDDMVARRRTGEPLQYVVGRWGFRSLDLLVDANVLIPRPETEHVVELAIAELARVRRSGRAPVVVDLGVGSGAIALSIAAEVTGARVIGVERSPSALAVARANLAGLGGFAATRVELREGSWYEGLDVALQGELDLIVSNPPYIAEHEVPGLDAVVRDWEPVSALVSGPTGLEDIEHVVAGAPAWLAPGGALVVELAPHQAEPAAALATDAGLVQVRVEDDLAGRPRALVAIRA